MFRAPKPSLVRLEQNYLLAALPAAARERLRCHLNVTPMALGEILYQPGAQMHDAYFPTTSIVSLLNVMASRRTSKSISNRRRIDRAATVSSKRPSRSCSS